VTATLDPSRSSAARAARLDSFGSAGRLRAYRAGQLDAADVAVWFGLYPDEVPTVNDEFEWIAATLE
jgi:hypothetical protein